MPVNLVNLTGLNDASDWIMGVYLPMLITKCAIRKWGPLGISESLGSTFKGIFLEDNFPVCSASRLP